MTFWRISNDLDLSGIGGSISDGRWHTASADQRVLYLSEHPALALVESLVNLGGPTRFFPSHFQLLKIIAAGQPEIHELTPDQLTQVPRQQIEATRATGDAWLAARSSALLRVPSIPSPESWNYLLNPLHSDASHIHIEWAKPITYDRRLFHLTDA